MAILNLLAVQLSWFACVIGAAKGMPFIGVLVSSAAVAMHLFQTHYLKRELKLILAALLMGCGFDSLLAASNLIHFTSGDIASGFTTFWMLGLWASFATSLTSSLKGLIARPVLALGFGAIGGPLAYASGARLGAMTISHLTLSYASIAVEWTIAMGIFVALVRRYSDAHVVGVHE